MQNPPEQQGPPFDLNPETLFDLQKELYRWQIWNFGEQEAERVILGICEETGELCHSLLKSLQGIRGTPEEHDSNMRDAIGDIMIYSINYLSGVDERMPSFLPDNTPPTNDETMLRRAAFTIFRNVSKMTASKTIDTDARSLFYSLNYFCALKGWNLEQILRETWADVGRRDWKTYPKSGFPEPSGEVHGSLQ